MASPVEALAEPAAGDVPIGRTMMNVELGGLLKRRALDVLERLAHNTDPEDRVDYALALADLLADDGRLADAESALRSALDVLRAGRPQARAVVLRELGRLELIRGRPAAAIDLLGAARQELKQDTGLLFDYGHAARLDGRYELAAEMLEQVVALLEQQDAGRTQQQQLVNAYRELGALHADTARYDEALKVMGQGGELHADTLGLRREIRRVREIVETVPLEERQKARELFAQARGLVSEHKLLADPQLMEAEQAKTTDDAASEARRLLTLALARHGGFIGANYLLARLYIRHSEEGEGGDLAYRSAVNHLEVCLQQRPDEARFAFLMGTALEGVCGMLGAAELDFSREASEAQDAFYRAVRINRLHADAWFELARVTGLHPESPDLESARLHAANARRLGCNGDVDELLNRIDEWQQRVRKGAEPTGAE
jgi:tetratricopeptide (TPR) repeat protein